MGQYLIAVKHGLPHTSSVAVGKDKSAVSVGKSGGVPDHLIHEAG